MTGAGSHIVESEAGRFEVEARSVNNRFLKTSVRAYGPLPNPEATVEARVRERIRRGHVSITVRYRPPADAAIAQRIDEAAFLAVAKRLKALAEEGGVKKPTTGDVLAAAQGMGDPGRAWDETTHVPVLIEAVDGALDNLIVAREAEGTRMADELVRVLKDIGIHTEAVRVQADEIPSAARTRLEARLEKLLEGTGAPIEPQWLAREVALLADKADVTEELARLAAHVEEFEDLLAEGGVVGRRLDFLVQELHREANTVGSKANQLELTRVVMDLKSDVERLREQVQNLE